LNNIDTGGKPITLGGGEPTIHSGFYNIVSQLRDDIKIDLLTNGQFDIDEFMDNIPPDRLYRGAREAFYYKAIRISYHVHSMKKDDTINTAKTLQDEGYNVGIFGINHPNNLFHNTEMTQRCADAGVYFFIRDFLGFHDDRLFGHYKYYAALNGNRKSCLCRPEDFLIGPEGNIYRCHRDLYGAESEVGNILNIAYEHKDDFSQCDNYGLCNPCDVKCKAKPDLVTTKCAVEIKEVANV
jgi:radical SAM protein with 4Fe4S-binding SPASM domain